MMQTASGPETPRKLYHACAEKKRIRDSTPSQSADQATGGSDTTYEADHVCNFSKRIRDSAAPTNRMKDSVPRKNVDQNNDSMEMSKYIGVILCKKTKHFKAVIKDRVLRKDIHLGTFDKVCTKNTL